MDLATYLSEHDITDAAFAAQVGLERSVITRLRNRKTKPSMASAERIFKVTNGAVAPNDFLDEPATAQAQTEAEVRA